MENWRELRENLKELRENLRECLVGIVRAKLVESDKKKVVALEAMFRVE
jgi:hypothetical protein